MTRRPTHVRRWIVAATMCMSMLLYLDRFCISFAEVYIKQDLGLTDVQVGWMLSSFFWAYALGQVPAGWLTDRFGARLMLTVYMLSWSIFTAATGFTGGIVGLLMVRLGFGLAQAGAYPTSGALLSRWIPLAARGTASSLVALGGRLGAALAPWLTALLIVGFVPAEHSSLLVSGDLLETSEIQRAVRTTIGGAASPEKAVAPPSQDATQPTVNQKPSERDKWLRGRVSVTTRHRLDQETRAAPPGARFVASPELLAGLANDLNTAIRDRQTCRLTFFDRGALPAEGWRLMGRDPQELTQLEVERLNRLLLETALPTSLRRVYVAGWRPVLLAYGVAGIPLAAGFWILFRNRPAVHPWCNPQEVKYIVGGLPADVEKGSARNVDGVPWLALVTDLSMWLNCLSQLATNVGWVFLVTWLPRYLISMHGTPIELRAWMTLIPVVGGMVGMFLGGLLTDWLVTHVGPRWGRSLPIGVSRFVAMGAYLLCLFHPSPWVAVALFSVVAFSTDLGIGALWAYVQDVGGRQVGSVLGWGNMWGNLGAAATPPLLIWIVGDNQNWDAAFLTCAGAFLVAGLAGLGIDATKKIQRRSSVDSNV